MVPCGGKLALCGNERIYNISLVSSPSLLYGAKTNVDIGI